MQAPEKLLMDELDNPKLIKSGLEAEYLYLPRTNYAQWLPQLSL